MKTHTIQVIELQDWDELVKETYGKPYSFQQQYGCQIRQMFEITIPSTYTDENQMHDEIPHLVNGESRGIKFDKWLEANPNETKLDRQDPNDSQIHRWIELFWHRNFYPSIYTVANDLYERGLIEQGTYYINIDW